jgi:protein-L-isoaspartate(D-aspartate) O-methyltransferase
VTDAFARLTREAMVEEHLIGRGIAAPAVLDAFVEVPRERFVRAEDRDRAYDDTALPLGDDGETISQPYIVARMAELGGLRPGARVLEIGTGSGYAAAIYAQIGAQVVSMERNAALAEAARARTAAWGVRVVAADGADGWPDGAPYDAVLVAAAVPRAMAAWKAQLAPDGRLVVPVGGPRWQVLRVWHAGRWTDHGEVAFVGLRRGVTAGS